MSPLLNLKLNLLKIFFLGLSYSNSRFLISKIFDAQLGQNYTLEDLYKQLSLSIFFKKSFSKLNKLCAKESKVFHQIFQQQ